MLIKYVLKDGWRKWDFCIVHQFLDWRGGMWERRHSREHSEACEQQGVWRTTTPSGWESRGDQKEVTLEREIGPNCGGPWMPDDDFTLQALGVVGRVCVK